MRRSPGADTRVPLARARDDGRIGHRRGVAEVFGVPLAGLRAWLLWRAYYLAQMPTFGRKLRIFVEWTWGMFFPNDITHLRFTRSRDLDGDERAADAAAPPAHAARASSERRSRRQDFFGASRLPPIFSHVPFGTIFQSSGSRSTFASVAQPCLAVPQSFWPALATP